MTSKPIYFCVYRITNLVENKHYYGYKSSKIHPSKVIGITYFSSSKDKEFIKDQKSNPDNYKYKIIQLFKTSAEALTREVKLHTKFNVAVNPNFYNKSKQTTTKFDTTGIKPSEKNRQKSSEAHKGIPKTAESNIKRSKTLTGRKLSEEHIQKLKQPKTKEHAENSSKARRKYLYITPVGTFDFSRALESISITKPALQNWCMNNEKIITKQSYGSSVWLKLNYTWEELEGKTFKDIGFSFRNKSLDF